MPLQWKLNLYNHQDDGPLVLYTNRGHLAPIDLSFDLNLNEASTFGCGVSLRDKRYIGHDWVSPFQHDFKLIINDGLKYKNKVLLEGVITHHEIISEAELSAIAGEDYLGGIFDRRGFPFDPTIPDSYPYTIEWDNEDPSVILNSIINTILTQDNSRFEYTLEIPEIGNPQTYRIPYGDTTSLRGYIDNFATGYPGFDYAFEAGAAFKAYPIEFDPTHTPVYTFSEDSEGALPGVLDGPKWVNTGPGGTHALGSGAGTGTQLSQNYGYIPSQQRYRRIDIFPAFGNLINLGQFRRAVAGSLGIALNPRYELSMTVDPDQINTTHGFWNDFRPGAYVFINKDLIAHRLNGLYKIVQMQCTVNTEGQAAVTLNMNRETNNSLNFSDTTP